MDQQIQTEQAPAPSVEDRIASIFSGKPQQAPRKQAAPQPEQVQEEPTQQEEPEAASEQPEEAAAPVEETFDLEIDGEKYTLPKKLEKGFMQERDYTQKSQSLAEQRRALEIAQNQHRISNMQADFQREAGPELRQLEMLDEVIKQAQAQDVSGFDLDKLIRHRMDLDSLKDRRNALNQSIEDKRKDWGNRQAQEIAKLRAQSLDIITKKIPGWSEATAKEIRQHALSEGYTEEELNSILDPRHAVTLWKAQQYDQLKSSAKPTVQNAKAVKTTPSNPMPQQVKDKLAFRKQVSKLQPGSPEHQALVRDRIARIFG